MFGATLPILTLMGPNKLTLSNLSSLSLSIQIIKREGTSPTKKIQNLTSNLQQIPVKQEQFVGEEIKDFYLKAIQTTCRS